MTEEMQPGTNILFLHENGHMIPGIYKGKPPGPRSDIYAAVHVTADTMIACDLDRCKRHRDEGMNRQVLKARIF